MTLPPDLYDGLDPTPAASVLAYTDSCTNATKRRKKQIQGLIRSNVETGSELFTDELKSYDGLESDYDHEVINHAEAYVRERGHTNGMENFWSLLKRGLHGTYVSVEPFHLFRYLDEQAYRYNHRKLSDSERFSAAVAGVMGKRLTFGALTGKRQGRGKRKGLTVSRR